MNIQQKNSRIEQAKQSLLLIVPIMSFGVMMATFIAPGLIGKLYLLLRKFG